MNLRAALRSSPLRAPYAKVKYRLSSKAREELFTGFYRDNIWGDDQSASGSGSNLAQTETLREDLPRVLTDLGVGTFLDVPCGDFFWMQHVDLGDIKYLGGDVVSELIADNERNHGGPARWFMRLDIVSDPLPAFDAIMVRDLFLHLPIRDVHRAIANIRRSGGKWLLTSDYPASTSNPDVDMGQHRFPNMTLPPFNFPQPQQVIDDSFGERPDKRLGVWQISDLP